LLTLRAVRALQSADVILFDDLVSRDVLDFARREARKILVGNTAHEPSYGPDDVHVLTIKLARQGQRVVRLKSCDPLNFAWSGEEAAAYRAAAWRSRSCRGSQSSKTQARHRLAPAIRPNTNLAAPTPRSAQCCRNAR